MSTISTILETAATRWPDRSAVYSMEGSTTFGEIQQEAAELSERLAGCGLQPGMRVGLHARNSAEFIIAAFAIMRCGGVLAPISHQLKHAEIETIVSETRLHATISDGAATLPESYETAFVPCYPPFQFVVFHSDDLSPLDHRFIRYTSGTTGKSKGVLLTDADLFARTEAAYQALGLSENDTVLWVLPMAYHFLVTILMYIRYGIPIALSKDLLADSIMNCADEFGATVMYASPMHYRVLAADKTDRRMNTLQWAISTSTAIPTAIQDGFFKRHQLPITQVYGIIEAGLPMVSRRDDPQETWQSVGRVAPDFEVEVQGGSGHLMIRGPGMYHAYLTPWEERPAGWFDTGDLAEIDNEGYVTIKGREKSMINVSGNKAFPEEIEAVLLTHPAITAARVYGAAHPLMGEIVCAELVSDFEIEVEPLLGYCRKRLSTYKVPQRVTFVDAIVETDSGKVKRG